MSNRETPSPVASTEKEITDLIAEAIWSTSVRTNDPMNRWMMPMAEVIYRKLKAFNVIEKAPQRSSPGDGVIDEAYLERRRDYLFSEMWHFVENCLKWNFSRVDATRHELMKGLDHYRETQTKLRSLSVGSESAEVPK